MKETLRILEHSQGFSIGWHLADDDGFGLMLDEYVISVGADSDAAIAAIKKMAYKPDSCIYGWRWETRGQAMAALKVAKLAVKSVKKPMLKWAVAALAAGWKAPKGWKP